ncbi:AAA family ATPase [Aquimarina sp. D1M17]|uniref:AAA family ATPase n=1 Tax=Aquimarina acroporae TaxID=2937283 RepID=UPI0020C1296E|nr:AAA family ATPase [Aquimarina acroporae]MCK8521935.1 AAA family ATPase [Aquimarina acroporae]
MEVEETVSSVNNKYVYTGVKEEIRMEMIKETDYLEQQPIQKFTSDKTSYKKYIINPNDEIKEPPALFRIQNKVLCTLGNFSAIIGKAKTKKSMFLAWLTAMLQGTLNDYVKTCIKGKKIIYVDTEQSAYHAGLQVKRIQELLDRVESNMEYVALRTCNPKERLKHIEEMIECNENLGLLIIDGIADLMVGGNNDEQESNEKVSLLMKWSEEKNIHIMTVLHTNKGNDHATGHLGSCIIKKAETIFSIQKDNRDNSISFIKSEFHRGEGMKDPLYFSVNDDGIPYIIDDVSFTTKSKTDKQKREPQYFELAGHNKVLEEMFKGGKEMKYTALRKAIKLQANRVLGVKLNDDLSKAWYRYYKKNDFIYQEKERMPWKLRSFEGNHR